MATRVVLFLVAMCMIVSFHAFAGGAAEEKTDIYMQVWSDYEELVRREYVPRIEKALPVKVYVEPGVSSDALAKMRAEKADPKHHIMFMDSPYVTYAKSEGLIVKFDRSLMPNLDEMYPEFILADEYGVGLGAAAMGIAYNSNSEPPTSWAELWKPEYKGQVSPPTFNQTNGIVFWIMAGAIKSGKTPQEAQFDPDACFAGMQDLLPNVQTFWQSDAQQLQMVSSGDLAFMGAANTKGTYANKEKGLAVDWAEPKEGAFQLLNTATVVKNSTNERLAMQVLNMIISEEFQTILVQDLFVGPCNSKVKQSERLAATNVPYGPEAVKRLIQVDWEWIADNRAAWTERWNKEIAQ